MTIRQAFIATGQLPRIDLLREETKMYVSERVASFSWLIHLVGFHQSYLPPGLVLAAVLKPYFVYLCFLRGVKVVCVHICNVETHPDATHAQAL